MATRTCQGRFAGASRGGNGGIDGSAKSGRRRRARPQTVRSTKERRGTTSRQWRREPSRQLLGRLYHERVECAAQHVWGQRRRQDDIELAIGEADDAVDARLVGDEQDIGRLRRAQRDGAVRPTQASQHVAAAIDDQQGAPRAWLERVEIVERRLLGPNPPRIAAPGFERLDQLVGKLGVVADDKHRQSGEIER